MVMVEDRVEKTLGMLREWLLKDIVSKKSKNIQEYQRGMFVDRKLRKENRRVKFFIVRKNRLGIIQIPFWDSGI